ncbi:hypothetical protein M9H77_33488 [Catharanthus roseus]|uniref:Uncharacterized protein n=1 Tax=Catharanthus roseus TaxID=4058 RepID=A0ACB9ZKA4_CATRO|nr:hypothetical protein M9H77_33488 [Catharanthus roseus]
MGLSSSIIINFAFIFTLILMPLTSYSIPFVVFHGIADSCKHEGVAHFTELLRNWSGSQGYCVEIGDGVWDSWFMPMAKQVSIACDKVKKISELNDGYNIVGLSQGNMVARGVIEFCDGPPVKNMVSLAGPHAGIASIPFCGSSFLCILLADIIELLVYSSFIQEHLAPANYIKIPTDIAGYEKGCKFLPKLNNEIHMNETYKKRFESLHNLVLIMFEQDEVLVPRETSLFGYFPDGSWDTVLPVEETKLYKEDWIGLKTLNEAGKVKFVNVTGHHLEISVSDIKKYVLPYLLEKNKSTTESSFLQWSPSFMDLNYWEGEEKLVLNLLDRI